MTAELRLLCRDQIDLISQRTALINLLRATLHEYYPAALEAFDDFTVQGAWQFVITFPTPDDLLKAGKKNWMKFFNTHKLYRPEMAEKRVAIFTRAGELASPSPAVTNAKSLRAATVAHQLVTVQKQIDTYDGRIAELFTRHPDFKCFGSLPGAGAKLAPRLLAEIGADRGQFATAEALQCYAGTARSPVSPEGTQMSASASHVTKRCARRSFCGRT
jgi:transposase